MKGPSYRATVSAFIISIVSVVAILFLLSDDPVQVLRSFALSPFTKSLYLGNMLDHASLVLLGALGFSVAFKAGLFNLGGEGQIALGAFSATLFALYYPDIPAPWGIIAGGSIAFLVASIFGILIGILKTRLQVSEVITSFLISLAIIPLVDFLIAGPFRDPSSHAMVTRKISEAYHLLPLLKPSRLSIGAIASVGCAIFTWVIIRHSRYGYDLRLIAANNEFARSQGVPMVASILLTLGISAGLHGLAGATAVYGHFHASYNGIAGGLGWSAIAAALLARTNPLGAIVGSLVLGFIDSGTRAAMVHTDVSLELGMLMQGIFFLIVTTHTRGGSRG
jgi:ABC-type uncharacterized transport system permease subunit